MYFPSPHAWRSEQKGGSANRQDAAGRGYRLMPSLPILSGRELVKVFAKDGWQMVRQRGSHMILVKEGHMATLSVPDLQKWSRARYGV
jgi:predicted RNA binding protein YcfA (HicA-like mRNA interferase family)